MPLPKPWVKSMLWIATPFAASSKSGSVCAACVTITSTSTSASATVSPTSRKARSGPLRHNQYSGTMGDMPRNDGKTDVIQVEDQFYIRAESSLADTRTLVLLHNDTFAIFDRYGDIQPVGLGQQGLFYQETRYLSRLELLIQGHKPLLLSSVIGEDNVMMSVDLTNPDMELPSGVSLPRGTLHLYRNKFLADGLCLDQITIHNFGDHTVETELCF